MKEKQKWPLHLVFVRHAESERNVAKQLADRSGDLEYGGRLRNIDVDITARGRKQAEATGRYLGQQFRFDRVFASPHRRTLHTAELIIGNSRTGCR
jgi:probable phosphoglycerate mutase